MSVSRQATTSSLIADLRRRVGWLEGRTAPAGAKKLDDLSDVTIRDPASGNVVTYNGSQWVNLPSVAGDLAVQQALGLQSDDGIFDEVSGFTFQPQFTVDPNTYQQVIVTATCTGISDSAIPVDADPVNGVVNVPTSWKIDGYDATGDPLATKYYGGMGTGGGIVSFPMWMHNDTDESADHTLYLTVAGVSSAYEFDATVEVRAESVFSMAAV